MLRYAALAVGLLLSTAALAAPADVQNYIRQLEAAQARDRDQRVAANIDALANNPGSPSIGSPQADITIVEFFDYACPYCKAAEPRLMALVKRDKGVRLVLKEFPILTKPSMVAARMALAARKQGKYEAYHLAMMRHQGQLLVSDIDELAKASGLDVARLKRDMNAPDVTDELLANFNLARAIRAFQTPAYIVGMHVLSSDSASIDFAAEVAAARKRVNQ
jgi:protein-disulfide isomerase